MKTSGHPDQDGDEILGGGNDRCLYLYDRIAMRQSMKIESHEDDVNAVAFVDGTHVVASGGDDGLCKVWDRRALRESSPVRFSYFTTCGMSCDLAVWCLPSKKVEGGAVAQWSKARVHLFDGVLFTFYGAKRPILLKKVMAFQWLGCCGSWIFLHFIYLCTLAFRNCHCNARALFLNIWPLSSHMVFRE